jgi:cell division protein FtsI (penicillin-binding protein 3)
VELSRWVRVRMCITAAALSVMLLGVAWRAYGLQVSEGERYRSLAQRQHIKRMEVPAPRGGIYDTTGREMAVTAQIDSVFANPREVEDVAGTAEQLAHLLGRDVRELESRLAAPRYFAWLERHVTERTAEGVRALGLQGIGITQEPRRFYPLKSLAGPVLGFAGIDGRGLDGVELSLDPFLAGEHASVQALRDASGAVMLSEGEQAARAGASVMLTLDRSVQFIAERALERTVVSNHAAAGTALVMDLQNGGLLAIANWPNYDPNKPGNYTERGARNRAVTDAYEIGSVMKIFSVAAALEAGAVRPDTLIDVENGRYRIGHKLIVDSYHDTLLTVGGVLKRSSNVGAYKIARRLGKDGLYQALQRYRFGQKTGIELPGERAGIGHPPRTWGETGLAAVSYGYNLMATPMQVLAAFAAVGRGGIYLPPRILKEVKNANGEIVYTLKPNGNRIMQADVARSLLPMLESVFDKGHSGGTARTLELAGFRAAGKTGTAHKVDTEHGGYQLHRYLASFIGLAPVDAPRIAVLVIVDEPNAEEHYGALVAGPAFAEIAGESLRYLGALTSPKTETPQAGTPEPGEAPSTSPPDVATEATDPAPARPGINPGGKVWVPDFRGVGVARALEMATQAQVKIEIQGSGRAVEQFPPSGYVSMPAECRVVFAPGGS